MKSRGETEFEPINWALIERFRTIVVRKVAKSYPMNDAHAVSRATQLTIMFIDVSFREMEGSIYFKIIGLPSGQSLLRLWPL